MIMMNIYRSLLIVSLIVMVSLSVSAEKVTVSISSAQPNAVEIEMMQELTDNFMEENPDIEVKWLYGSRSATDLLGLYLQFFEAQSSEVDVMAIDVI